MTRIDRRALFTSGAAAALLAASGVSAAPLPNKGGHLRLALPRDGSLLQVAEGAAFERLTEIAPDGTLRGELAAAWEGSADARRWHFRLVEGGGFHDGTVLTPRHIADSLLQSELPDLREVHIDSASEYTVELSRGNPHLPLHMADPRYAIRAGDPLVGTGPYRIVRLDAQRQVLAVRADTSPRKAQPGWVDRFEAVVIPDAAIRAEALRDGHVDVAYLPDAAGLTGRGDFWFHPSAKNLMLASTRRVGHPAQIGASAPLDDGRIALRWWMV